MIENNRDAVAHFGIRLAGDKRIDLSDTKGSLKDKSPVEWPKFRYPMITPPREEMKDPDVVALISVKNGKLNVEVVN